MTDEQKPRLGVAVLVTNDQGRLLLGRRGKEPNYGKWVLPGGGVKFGERWVETAKREILEEAELHVDVDPLQTPYVLEVISDTEHRVILYVQATVRYGTLKASSDLLEASFFPNKKFPADISSVVVPVLRVFGWS